MVLNCNNLKFSFQVLAKLLTITTELITVVSPCVSIAATLVTNPVAHCWSEPNYFKRKFCNVCRKKIEDSSASRCEICEYYAHLDCQDFAVADCKTCATYVPDKDAPCVIHFHHWREGNLPTNSKCNWCKKACWSVECLAGMRCEWCGTTVHAACLKHLSPECMFGMLQKTIKVYDGNYSMKRRVFRTISISKTASRNLILETALRAFHVREDPKYFYVTDALSLDEVELDEQQPLLTITRRDGRRPAVFLRFRDTDNDQGYIKVYPGKLRFNEPYRPIPVTVSTTVEGVIEAALNKFDLEDKDPQKYRISEVTLDKGAVMERVMERTEKPWEILKLVGKDSIRQMGMTRFYLQQREDPHGPTIALFVGNLPPNLSQRQYERLLLDFLGKSNRFSSIGPIYYEYGSMVITYENADAAVKAFYTLRESVFDDKTLMVLLLPHVQPQIILEGVQPLLVFVNVKSGGCQGLELITSFRKLLNPYQVFDLENGGPLPGLYVFRQVKRYKILVCGGDGTIGWVLQCLDNVGQDSECQSPACAVVPLGTGNDLARVLRWGSGYTGGEDPINLLKDIIEAEEIKLDRWTVVFHVEEKPEEKPAAITNSTGSTSEDNTQIFVMNNYFGIGIDADLCLDFHNAREENPNKFNSRLHNKGVYVKMGLRKMVSRKMCKDLHKEIRLEVDGKVVDLPPVEGIIILNILSWGSGANPWGPEKDDQFQKPTHHDGMLEVVGVTGVVHLGQIQSGLRSAMRIAQGGHIKIRLNSEMPVQVDGEPWVQSPGEVVVLKSALKATMLKKIKSKIKRRNTEPSMMVTGNAPFRPELSSITSANNNSGPF
ncbi:hypothetical protein CHUAL_002459 [Chamberlinius hualienensis]